jgi:hypothetical protein
MAMLKFRATWFLQEPDEFLYYAELKPYSDAFSEAKERGIDFVGDYLNKKCIFLDNSKIYIQSFPGIISSEARLICGDYKKIKEYDYLDYDQKFYYYNWIYRQFAFIDNGFLDANLGIDGCNDCGLMIKIFKDYFTKFHINKDIKLEIKQLLNTIKRRIKAEFHGSFLKPFKNINEILEKQKFFVMFDFYQHYKHVFKN